jgi:hypothetical protein
MEAEDNYGIWKFIKSFTNGFKTRNR